MAERIALKEERAREAATAMREYEAERFATAAKTARLRALRIAKERAEALARTPPKEVKKTKAARR
jgi:hypothetical protein